MADKPTDKSAPRAERSGDPERRAAILDAADKLFRHYGPGKTTIGDIAREADVGVGSVYLEFCSKDEIVGELSGRRHHRVLSAMRSAAGTARGAERLTRALEARVDTLFELREEGTHSCDLVMCASTKGSFGRFRSEERELVIELLRGEGVKDAARVAELIERAHATLSPPWLFELDRRRALALCRELNAVLVAGVFARPARRSAR